MEGHESGMFIEGGPRGRSATATCDPDERGTVQGGQVLYPAVQAVFGNKSSISGSISRPLMSTGVRWLTSQPNFHRHSRKYVKTGDGSISRPLMSTGVRRLTSQPLFHQHARKCVKTGVLSLMFGAFSRTGRGRSSSAHSHAGNPEQYRPGLPLPRKTHKHFDMLMHSEVHDHVLLLLQRSTRFSVSTTCYRRCLLIALV